MSDLLERLKSALADRYAVESEIGRGGMATVFLAEDLRHKRQVAIKVLHPELAASVGTARFLREIETVAGLTHPHILPLHDSGDAGGLLYYVMPYVEGESLAHSLEQRRQLSLTEARRIAGEVADGLGYAHEQGVVHRDIKPGNILLARGHALICDFGVAKAFGSAREADATATGTGLSVGTPRYMSPEQAAGGEVDGRSDVYALGCVLWEMLAGEPPFDGPTPHAILARKTTQEPPRIRVVRKTVSQALEASLAKAMATSPADRFQTAGEFAAALQAPETIDRQRGQRQRSSSWKIVLPIALSAAMVVTGAVLAFSRGWIARGPPRITASNMRPVTNARGVEYQPAISPDGSEVAYVERHAEPRIVVRSTLNTGAAGDARPGAQEAGLHWLPSWTPDGASVRFLVCREPDSGVVFGASCSWKEAGKFGGSTRTVAVPRKSVSYRWATTRHAWSRDGKRLAFVLQDSIFAFSADGAESELLAVHPGRGEPPPFPHSLVWSPDGRRIAYVQGNSGWRFGLDVQPSSIWILDAGGGEPVRVTDHEYLNVSPQWLPDSRHLLFVSNRDGSRGIYLVAVVPDGPRGLPQSVSSSSDPHSISISADGRALAYSNLTAGASNIWSIPIPTTGTGMTSIRDRAAITTGHQTVELHGLSPDGEWIVFDSDRQGGMDIWKQRLDDGGGPLLVADVEGDAWEPDWSPDGAEIVFSTAEGLHIVPAEGGAPEGITAQGARPDWSPDGLAIAFQIDDDPAVGPNVWVVSRDTVGGSWGDPVQLTESGCWYPDWFPDGMSLLCGTHADTPGREAAWARVSTSGEILSRFEPSSVGMLGAWYAQLSADGSRIYAVAHHEDGTQGFYWVPAEGGNATKVVALDEPGTMVSNMLTVGRSNLYVTISEAESDIWAMDLNW